jgi:hypothetical protein
MQAAVDRVMKTYGMIVNLTVDEERAARQRACGISEASGREKLRTEDERHI